MDRATDEEWFNAYAAPSAPLRELGSGRASLRAFWERVKTATFRGLWFGGKTGGIVCSTLVLVGIFIRAHEFGRAPTQGLPSLRFILIRYIAGCVIPILLGIIYCALVGAFVTGLAGAVRSLQAPTRTRPDPE
ncbi:hypothetical protein [Singulisphaera sp. PoT]|uniref:hypothetical protein n=1 Tax=Singulisphaera sp. PoT TaxID=3411797 RepID=UPI003BF4F25D